MQFDELLAQYLRLYGDYIRWNGAEIEYRGIQQRNYTLAKIVEHRNLEALAVLLEHLKEDLDAAEIY